MIITIETEGRRSLFQLADDTAHDKVREAVKGILEPGSYTLLEDIAVAPLERQRKSFDDCNDDGQEAPR